MARKSWDQLTDASGNPSAYRRRLERSGITREYYESGGSLAKARGHAATPEHPHEAARNPAKYARYIEKRPNVRRTMHALVRQQDKYNIQTVAHTQWRKTDKSTIAMHWNAIRRYLKAGDFERQLGPFEGVTIGGTHGVPIYELETDHDVIDRFLHVQDSPPFEDIYDEPE